MSTDDLGAAITEEFERNGVFVERVDVRSYPNEINALVFVHQGAYGRAIEVAEVVESAVSSDTQPLLVVVRRSKSVRPPTDGDAVGVQSEAAARLQRLISSRSRVSEIQPSLSYVKDLTENVAAITAPRHHLVFGRRGAGKSTLLVEARREVQQAGALTAWVNIQTMRRDEPPRVFARVMREALSAVVAELTRENTTSEVSREASEMLERTETLIRADQLVSTQAERLVPDIQRVIRRSLHLLGRDLYLFIDDFYYVPRADQPALLDMIHGCTRDSRAWLKVASIRHLTRWFVASPPLGLQTGHDAEVIDLDVTLEQPKLVRRFLIDILQRYAVEVGVPNLRVFFRPPALDRLVLASGGVPRDFLVLAGAAIGKARGRENARQVGVQEVNLVAGEAAAVKIQELEEDLAANAEDADRSLKALTLMRRFCLEETSSTYYRVDFFDKEANAREYQVFIDLMDLRLIHLIHGSVSDAHEAGRRFEVFMLDLSQFTGSRLKQGIRVLDLQGDVMVAMRTRQKQSARRATTPLQLLAILRTAPIFPLANLREFTERA